MTGAEVVRTIPAQRRTLPVCVLAGRDDAVRRVATPRGRDLGLTARELEVPAAPARGQLPAEVWGYTWEVDGDVVDVFVGGLRRKLEAAGEPRVLDHVSGHRFVVTA